MRTYQESLLSLLNDPSLGAEVGVQRGRTSELLLSHNPHLTLLMVDKWEEWKSMHFHTAQEQRGHREAAMVVRNKYAGRVVVLEGDSAEMAGDVDDGSLDFVFIDADHFEVMRDLEAWYPKLRPSGVFCGHDYGKSHFRVTEAVDEFAAEHSLTVEELPGSIWVAR